MDINSIVTILKSIKPGEEFKISFRSAIPTTKEFRATSNNSALAKVTGVTTVTGLDYENLEDVKAARAERAAAVERGEAKPVREVDPVYEPIIPHTLVKHKGTGKQYVCLYPTTCWKDPYKTYQVIGPDGEIDEIFEDINDIRGFISPREWEKRTAKSTEGGKAVPPIIRIPLENVFDIKY